MALKISKNTRYHLLNNLDNIEEVIYVDHKQGDNTVKLTAYLSDGLGEKEVVITVKIVDLAELVAKLQADHMEPKNTETVTDAPPTVTSDETETSSGQNVRVIVTYNRPRDYYVSVDHHLRETTLVNYVITNWGTSLTARGLSLKNTLTSYKPHAKKFRFTAPQDIADQIKLAFGFTFPDVEVTYEKI